MVSLKTIFTVSLFLALCAANHEETTELPHSLHGESSNLQGNPMLPNVMRNKCQEIEKKKRKSFFDLIYLKLRCKSTKSTKSKKSSKSSKSSKSTKPKVPTLPKIQIPKIPKPKIPKIQIPKIPTPKIPKIKIPTIPKPKLPKIQIPKIPKPSLLRGGKESSSISSKKKPNKQVQRSPTPSPCPRRPSPSPSLEKLKKSLESTKKRMVENINKRKKPKPKVCKTEEYVCGKKCSGRAGPRFLCHYPNHVPKFCTRKAAKMGFCEGKTGNTCVKSVMEPGLCARNMSVTEYCPGAEHGCRFNNVPVGKCLPDKLADNCERIKKKPCSYNKRTLTIPCESPKTYCKECKGRFRLKTCKTMVKERVEVACPLGKKGLPTFDEELRGNGIESRYVRDVLCFDSFFDESVCKNAPRVCRLFDEIFDRRLCADVICHECVQLMRMHVSGEIKGVCKSLLEGSCIAAGSYEEVVTTGETGEEKCYKTRTVEKQVPCYNELPRDKICAKGCMKESCKKTVHETKGYCKKNVPQKCLKIGNRACKREMKRVRDCSGERICQYVVKKQYLCFGERKEEVPCDEGCLVEGEEKFVCGSEKVEVEAICREQFEYSCRSVVCSRRVCR